MRRPTIVLFIAVGAALAGCGGVAGSADVAADKALNGPPVAELMADRRTVAEGAFTAPVLARLAQEKGVEMPIVEAVDAMLAGRSSVDAALESLLSRPLRAEAS